MECLSIEARVLSLVYVSKEKRYRGADIGENGRIPAGLKSLLLAKNTVHSCHSRALISRG